MGMISFQNGKDQIAIVITILSAGLLVLLPPVIILTEEIKEVLPKNR